VGGRAIVATVVETRLGVGLVEPCDSVRTTFTES
jgi:hypothetical protein